MASGDILKYCQTYAIGSDSHFRLTTHRFRSHARPKVVDLAVMSDLIALGLAAMTATDNVFFIEANDVASVLPRFQPPWLPENQDLCSFDLKTCFATLFLSQNIYKTPYKP